MKDLAYMESEVLKILQLHANDTYARDELAPWIAKTSLQMGHLYSDLGLESRKEMGEFMSKNFTSLSKLKPEDKRWKKFLYDCIGKTAPACATCYDITNCFTCSLNPIKVQKDEIEEKKTKIQIVKERAMAGKKDLFILVSFEVAVLMLSFLFTMN
jgi:nitrogen fixation protein NifQ